MTDAYERAKRDDAQWEREHDSREKIERDSRVIADNLMMYGGKSTFGAYDIIALLDRQAAITTRECTAVSELGCEACRAAQKRENASMQAKVDELQAELATAEADNEFLRDELGSEPFCEQVKRWLGGDAPKECRECGDGCYMELCEAFGVKPKRTVEDVLCDAVGELFNANISAGSDEWENVIEKYADELRGMGVCDE